MKEDYRDAAFAKNIGAGWKGVVGVYLEGGDAFHPWSLDEINMFRKNKKLPIYVQSHPINNELQGRKEAFQVLQQLFRLRIPNHTFVELDLETAVAPEFVHGFGNVLRFFHYKLLPYGSTSTIFQNPQFDGYSVASPSLDGKPFMFTPPKGKLVRITQYALDVKPGFDSNTIKWYTLHRDRWWI